MHHPILTPAQLNDAEALVGILAEDDQGGHDEGWSEQTSAGYRAALAAILEDSSALLLVARSREGHPLGLAHAVRMPGLSDRGATLVQLVSLFVGRAARGQKVGSALLGAVEGWAQDNGATFVTLVSNKARGDAHRFYRAHGYDQRHEGFKKTLGFQEDPGLSRRPQGSGIARDYCPAAFMRARHSTL